MEAVETGRPRRPALVWLISIGYGLVAVVGFAHALVIATGAAPVPEPLASEIARLGALAWIPGIVGAALALLFCTALFRLRAVAVRWCEALILLSLATTGLQFALFGIPDGEPGLIALGSTAFSFGLLGAIYLYSRRLRSRGILG